MSPKAGPRPRTPCCPLPWANPPCCTIWRSVPPVVLVFYRSGWCPHCNTHLRGFQRILDQLQQNGAEIVAISPQLPDHTLSIKQKNALSFPVFSNVENQATRRYGIVFPLSFELHKIHDGFRHPLDTFDGQEGARKLPMPATFMIAKSGVILHAKVEFDHTRRLDPEDVLAIPGSDEHLTRTQPTKQTEPMSLPLENKLALVTGFSRGIGAAIA